MNEKNILFTSLGKAVSSNIKFMTQIKIEKSKGNIENVIFCLSTDQLILLTTPVMQKYETIKYENLEKISFHKNDNQAHKINSKLSLHLIEESENLKTKELKFISDDRPFVIKNILCFYSVFFLYSKNEVRHLPTFSIKHELVDKQLLKKSENGPSVTFPYTFKTLNDYCFFLNYKVKQLADNQSFLVQTNTKKEFKVKLNISSILKMTLFEEEKDLRDLSAYAYEEAYKYMLVNCKKNSERFKIIKNSLYFKKYNFNEDKSVWEGWTIRFRKCNLNKSNNNNNNNNLSININYNNHKNNTTNNNNNAKISTVKNYAFIFLRRKFLFPYYDSFRNFSVILEEECRENDFDFSKEATDVLELAADSLATTFKLPEYFKGILDAKLDSLLLDEEILTFYLNNLKINEVEIIWIGYAFVNFILEKIMPKNNDESFSKFNEWMNILKICWGRIKHGFNEDNKNNSLVDLKKKYNPKNNDTLTSFMEEMYTLYLNNQKADKDFEDKGAPLVAEMNTKKLQIEENLLNEKDDSHSNNSNDENETPFGSKGANNEIKNSKGLNREGLNWRSKVNRFLYFCLNGGLCDYAFSFRDISDELLKNIEFHDSLLKLMNFIDLDKLLSLKETDDHIEALVNVDSLSEKMKVCFNEEAVCGMIRTGTLFKLLSDKVENCINLFRLLLKEKYASNKILGAIYSLFMQIEDQKSQLSQYIDRSKFIDLVPNFLNLFKNTQNLHKLLLVSKCLAFLTKFPNDKTSRLTLIQEENLNYIFLYLEKYRFDDAFMIVLFEILDHLIDEMNNKLSDILYSIRWNLMGIFQTYLTPSEIIGTYRSQSAGIKEKFCEDDQADIFRKLIDICDDQREKYKIIDSKEDYSYVLEFKVFYLLGILVFKNSSVKNIISAKVDDVFEFFIRKSKFYKELIENVIKHNDKISRAKINSIKKALTKFFEFVFYFFKADNDDRLRNLTDLISLSQTVNKEREVLCLNDTDFDVFKWIKKETTNRDL